MHLILLGSPTLQTDDGQPVSFDTRKATAILAYLALHDEPFQRDTIAAMYWPELDQSRARAALRRTLTPINKTLGEDALIATRETVALNPDYHLWVDSRAFESSANEFRHHGHPETETCNRCVESLKAAISLYKGDFMAGFTLRDAPEFDNWQFFEADRLRRLYALALERLIPLLVERGELDPAVEHARRWLSIDPLHEPAHRALMRLYAQTNQRAAALRQYRECVRILDEELGVPPLEETKQLYEEILENRFSTTRRPSDPASQQTSEPTTQRTTYQKSAITQSPAPPISSQQLSIINQQSPNANYFPLTGRASEMATLLAHYGRLSPDGYFTGIEGEAGVGKTRLAEEFLAQVQIRGAVTITARCYRGEEQLAYAPLIGGIRNILGRPDATARLSNTPPHYLAESARLLPELMPNTPYLDVPQYRYPISSSQTRLFESLRQILLELLTGPHPGVLFIDDLQWTDSASLDLLIYLIRRLQDYPVFIVTAWRKEGDLSRLTGLLAESQRAGLGTKINLERLTFADVEKLASDVESITSERIQALFDETEGLPYFVVEYLTATRQGKDWTHLTSVQDLQRARLTGLDETARQLLATASVIGRSFEFDTLHNASGRSEEETITGLETLLSRGLLVEHRQKEDLHPSSFPLFYDFIHEIIRTVIYEDTSLARRRLLHRRVAEVVINRSRDMDESAARIAYHYERAGQDADAAIYYHRAGDHARKLYANTESLSHYQSALALGHPEPCGLHESIGDLKTLQGDYPTAVASYETAAALANTDSLARIEYKLANLHHRRGDYDLAASYFQTALDASGKQNDLRAQILADWSRTCGRQKDHLRAVELAEEALALSHLGSDPAPAGQAHNVLGMIARQAGDTARASGHLQQALQIAEAENHLPAQIAALNNLSLVYGDQQDYLRAVELAQKALDLCARLGDRHREAALRNRLADLFHASNQPSAAMYHLKKAVEIFAEIGGSAGDNEPEIWKLTEW